MASQSAASRDERILAAAEQARGAWKILFVHAGGSGSSSQIRAHLTSPAIDLLAQHFAAEGEANVSGLRVDLRLNWKQATTSIAATAKEVDAGGEASLAVADDSHEGAAATVTLLDAGGNVVDYKPTTVGEGG